MLLLKLFSKSLLYLESRFGYRSNQGIDGGILVDVVLVVVVPGEGVECPQLVPPRAHLGVVVAEEPADVGSDHGEAELVELQDPDDGELEVVPLGVVVAWRKNASS